MKKFSAVAALLVLIALAAYFAHRARTHGRVSTLASVQRSPERTQPATAAERLALARAACGGQVSVDAKQMITCSVCPANSDFAGPGMPGSPTGWTLDSVLYGHFTAADADEALVRASGCESHAKSFGGNLILRNQAGTWSPIRYASGGTATDKCQKIRWVQNRDALICQTGDMHAGIASDAVQFLLFDAEQPPDDDFNDTGFLSMTDESANCGFEGDPGRRRLIQMGQIDAVRLLPPSAAGQQVAIEATVTRVAAPKAVDSDCPKGKPQAYRVVFQTVGDHFEAKEGYAAFAALKREDCCELTISKMVRPGRY